MAMSGSASANMEDVLPFEEQGTKIKWTCCCELHTALAAIMDCMDAERSAAEDRQKRLLTRIDQLSREVKELKEMQTNEITEGSSQNEKDGGEAVAVEKKKKKAKGSRGSRAKQGDALDPVQSEHGRARPNQETSCSSSSDDPRSRSHSNEGPRAALASATTSTDSNSNKFDSFSDLLGKFEEMDDEDDAPWSKVTRRKPAPKKSVFFVGKLKKNNTAEEVKEFIKYQASKVKHPVEVFEVSIFPKAEFSSARIVVSSADAKLVTHKRFWPKPSYIRKWKFTKDGTADGTGGDNNGEADGNGDDNGAADGNGDDNTGEADGTSADNSGRTQGHADGPDGVGVPRAPE